MGISFEYRANATKASGAPVELIFPKEGVGWDMEAASIMKPKKQDHAQGHGLGHHARSERGVRQDYAIVAMPGVVPLPNLPPNYEQMLVKNDFGWAAKNRDRILAEWNKRYNAKAEPK